MTSPTDPRAGAGSEPDPGPTAPTLRAKRSQDPDRRRLDPDWRERHIRGQADGSLPPGRIQMRYDDGTLVTDRLGRPRMWSEHVANATIPGRPHSREVERIRQQAELAARDAIVVRALAAQVQAAFRPPPGKLFGVNVEALMVTGPLGGIGTTAAIARILAPLAAGGRHGEAAIAAAIGCRDAMHLRELLAGITGKLAAIGLRVDRRKAGIRIAKLKPATRSV